MVMAAALHALHDELGVLLLRHSGELCVGEQKTDRGYNAP